VTSRSGIRGSRASFSDSDARWFASDERTEVAAELRRLRPLSSETTPCAVPSNSRVIGQIKRDRGIGKKKGPPNDRVPRIHETSQCEYRASVNRDILNCE